MAGLALNAHALLPIPAAYLNASDLVQPAMHVLSSLLVLGTCALQSVLGRPGPALRAEQEALVPKRSVDSFISTETPIAWHKLLCNIGPDGCAAAGAAPGAVVASPSKTSPDCKCQLPPPQKLTACGIAC